jgi:hypothetical protein
MSSKLRLLVEKEKEKIIEKDKILMGEALRKAADEEHNKTEIENEYRL